MASIDTTLPPVTSSIDTGLGSMPISDEVAAARAFRAKTGLPSFDWDFGKLYEDLRSGQEQRIRDAAAAFADQQKEQFRQQALGKIASKTNGPLTQQDYDVANKIINKRMEPTSPYSVFEEYYPVEYLDNVRKTGEVNPSPWKQAHPADVDREFFRGRDYMARQEMLRTYAEAAEAALKAQGTAPYIIDQLKGLVPGFTQIKQRGLMGSAFFQGKMGENLDEQSNNFFNRLPFDQARALLQAEGKKLINDDPSLAVSWAHALLGQSYQEKLLNNMSSMFDIPIGGGLKVVAGQVAKLGGARVGLNTAREAVKSAIKTGAKDAPTNGLMAEAAGDLKTSAVHQLSEEVASKMAAIQERPFATGKLTHILENPALNELRGMPDSFAGIMNELAVDLGHGRLNKEAYNRLKQRTSQMWDTLVETISNTTKVERIPSIDAAFRVMRAVADSMVNEYPGMANRILNNTLRYDKSINGHWIDYFIGGEGGQLFKSWKEADEFARANGLQSEVWRGRKVGGKTSKTIWSNKDFDVPVEPVGKPNKGPDGRMYQKVVYEGKESFVPADELKTTHAVGGESFQTLEDVKYKENLARMAAHAPGASLEDVEAAAAVVKKYQVQQQGTGFYIKVSKPLPETGYVVREGLLDMPGSTMPKSWITARFGVYRTPNENLGAEHIKQRLAAQHAPANYAEVVAENNKEIQGMRQWALPALNQFWHKHTGNYLTNKGQKWDQFKMAMTDVLNARDKETGKLMDIGEFQTLYQNKYQRLPDEQEIAALHSYKRDEATWQTFDALKRYTNLHREGGEKITIQLLDPEKESKGGSGLSKEFSFHGAPEKKMPSTKDPIIYIPEGSPDNGGKIFMGEHKVWNGNPKGIFGKGMAKKIENGEIVLFKVLEPGSYPFEGFGGLTSERVAYVAMHSNFKRENIKWQDLVRPRLPDYDAEHFLEQGIFKSDPLSKKTWLEGARTIAGINVRGVGKDLERHINAIRLHFKNGDEAAAQAYHSANDLQGIEWSTIRDWFQGSTIRDLPSLMKETPLTDMDKAFWYGGQMEVGQGFHVKPMLDVNHPVRLIPRGKSLADMDEKYLLENQIHDGTRSKHGRYFEGQIDYRDVKTIDNRGTRENPLYNMQSTPFVDPFTSINRALNRVIKDSAMDDYKTFAIEHWIQEAKQYLNVLPKDLLEHPAYYFYHNENLWSKNPEHAERVQSLRTARLQIQQFVGVQSEHTTFVHSMAQKLSDSLYENGYKHPIVPGWMLPLVKDPFTYLRSATMHMKMGLFALPQLLVQMQTFTNIFGIAGAQYAAPGAKAALLHQWAHWAGPEALAGIDRVASTKLIPGTAGFRPGDFIEARNLLKQTGFSHVGGEHVRFDSPGFDFLTSERQQFLNLGKGFFTYGEKATRIGAWYTAYLEHRMLNPTGAITEQGVKDILKRADLLTINMTRASASRLHEGWLSMPTQFFSYQIRLGELVLGKRLTDYERFRLFYTNALMYGVPIAFGISGLPIGDWMRKEAIENGYVVGDNWWNHLMTEGLPATIAAIASGGGDVSKGSHLNFGERFGSSGLEPLREAMRSDQTVLDLMGGAAYSTFRQTIANASPWWHAVMSMIKQDDKYKLKGEDFVDPFLQISSVNNAKKLWTAWNTGKWITANEGYVDNISKVEAVLRSMTGLGPQKLSDYRTMQWSTEWIKADQKKAELRAIKELRRSFEDQANNDPEQAVSRVKRALVELEGSGYSMDQLPRVIGLAAKGWESIIDRGFREYYSGKGIPEARKAMQQQPLIQHIEQKTP